MDTSEEYCCLREYFEKLDGEPIVKEVTPELLVGRGIVDIEERPSYTSFLRVFKGRKLSENERYVFAENIYTNDPFLERFKSFLRASAEEVEAENFEDIPLGYGKDWYNTSHGVPVVMHEARAVLHVPGKMPKLLKHKETFRGVDFSRKCTLRLVKAETINERLREIERKSNFSAMILYINKVSEEKLEEELKALEGKMGIIHYAVTKI